MEPGSSGHFRVMNFHSVCCHIMKIVREEDKDRRKEKRNRKEEIWEKRQRRDAAEK